MGGGFKPSRGALKGARKVKRLLKRLPDDVRTEINDVYRAKAPEALAYMQANAPGSRIAKAMRFRIAEKTSKLLIGLIGRKANSDLFFARILEQGRKAKTVQVKRRTKGGGTTSYALRVKAIARTRYDFVRGRAATFVFGLIRQPLATVWTNALRRAASGGGGD